MATLSATSIQSETLVSLRSLVDQSPLFKHFQGIFQLTVIIDANIILRDLLWLTKKRVKPDARSELKELLDAETVLAIAPTFLQEEIVHHIQKFSDERSIPHNVLMAEWETYKARIRFVDVGGPDQTFLDPKDAPYIKLQRQSGHLIYSRDTDILRMGGMTAPPILFANLRLYSRQVVIEYTLKAGGQGTLVVTFALAAAVTKFTRALVGRASKGFLWTAALVIVCALIYGPTRQFLKNLVAGLPEKSQRLGGWLSAEFAALADEHEKAKEAAGSALAAAKQSIDKPDRL
jgi:predicted nucleic acid-binding protein